MRLRLLRRRRDALDLWRAELPDAPRWSAQPEFRHAPDLDPSEVGPPPRVGMDGRPLPKSKGAITGMEGGGSPDGPLYHGG
jgi:hypothetical protein